MAVWINIAIIRRENEYSQVARSAIKAVERVSVFGFYKLICVLFFYLSAITYFRGGALDS